MIWKAGSTASGAHYIAGWREDNFSLWYTLNIPKQDAWKTQTWAKKELIQHVNHETGAGMDTKVLTVSFT